MNTEINYCCIYPGCNHSPLVEGGDGIHCSEGHVFPYTYIKGIKIPVFACEEEDANEYSIEDAAEIHDNALRWVFMTFGVDEESIRSRLVNRLNLLPGNSVLITGAGAGNDLPFIAKLLQGAGCIYAQDISKQMLIAAVDRYYDQLSDMGIKVYFSASDATNLPFENNIFDAAYHFGGLNLFSDIKKGISEMNRVVKPGGKIVLSDEGVAPWFKDTELGKMLINNNPLYRYDAPLSFIPETARSVELSWELCNCFYVIEFVVSDSLPHVNIDVPHVGKRGGSIRKRYLGQLEGIDPVLKDKLYAEATKRGMSRVEYLEKLIKDHLGN